MLKSTKEIRPVFDLYFYKRSSNCVLALSFSVIESAFIFMERIDSYSSYLLEFIELRVSCWLESSTERWLSYELVVLHAI